MPSQPRNLVHHHGNIGKISCLPVAVREEVCRRMDEGHCVREILEWLNGQEEVRRALEEKWEKRTVERHSIASWRKGGYQEWKRKREQLERLKELSEYALKLGQASGGSVADGSAAIAGGRIMSALESASDEDMLKMVRAISVLRTGDFNKARLGQNQQKLAQNERKLELERRKFQRQSTELFLEWYDNKKVREIVEGRGSNAEKIELLGREIFGEHW